MIFLLPPGPNLKILNQVIPNGKLLVTVSFGVICKNIERPVGVWPEVRTTTPHKERQRD